jgi:hypothetical protein
MKKLFSITVAILIITSVSFAQKRETRDVSAFTKISLRGASKAYVKQELKDQQRL